MRIKNFDIGEGHPLCVITGPCVIESEDHTLFCAENLKKIFEKKNVNFIFKASFDKANRSSITSFRGPGMEEGLEILSKVKARLDIPVTTDIHLPNQAKSVADVCDIIQIPAFLCRQTDLIIAAANTNLPINIKKGQFLSPHEMKNVVDKVLSCNNDNIILTERGTFFGYNNLVTDFTSIHIMKSFKVPICFDATHSVQKPGMLKTTTGGAREFTPLLAKAAIVAGCTLLFLESHSNPKKAKSDASTVIDLQSLENLLNEVEKLYNFCHA